MKKRWSAFLLVLAVTLSACGNKNKRPDGELVTAKDPVRGFLSAIPADTPYAFVAVEPMPLGPWLHWMQRYNDAAQSAMSNYEQVFEDQYVDPTTKLVFAVMKEFEGKYTPEGLKSLGLSSSPRMALYGLGALPVLKFDLADPDAFMAFLDRVEQKAGVARTVETVDDEEFWSYPLGRELIVMTIINRQLAVGITPPETAETYVRYFAGADRPETSMADVDTLSELRKRHGYQAYGAGFIDFERFAQILLKPEPGLNDTLTRQAFGEEFPSPSQTCVEETMSLVKQAPRVVTGYEDWTPDGARIGIGLELTNDVGTQLAAAKAPTPVTGSEFADRSPAYLAFGFHVGALVELAQTKAAAVRAAPFACEWYRDLNRAAEEVSRYAPTLPGLVTNLQGGAAVLQSVRRDASMTAPSNPPTSPPPTTAPTAPISRPQWKVEGLALVASANPIGLFDFARSFVPEYVSLAVQPNGKAAPLPPSSQAQFLDMPHVVLSQKALAVTSGDAMVETGEEMVERVGSGSGPFMVVAYDLSRLMQMYVDASGVPMPSGVGANLFEGRTEIVLDPDDDGVFAHVDLEFGSQQPQP